MNLRTITDFAAAHCNAHYIVVALYYPHLCTNKQDYTSTASPASLLHLQFLQPPLPLSNLIKVFENVCSLIPAGSAHRLAGILISMPW